MKHTKTKSFFSGAIFCLSILFISNQGVFSQLTIQEWTIQSGYHIKGDGNTISSVNYDDSGWYPFTGATTVLAALVKNGVYPDPYYGTNLMQIPGYRHGYRLEMPDDSPFKARWWYRSEFDVPSDYEGQNIYLLLHSINYKANIWINGRLLADTTKIEGTFRLFELDITQYATPGKRNAIALEIVPPTGNDPSIRWMQGTRLPPDNDAGIWYDVKIKSGGAIHIRDTYVSTKLNLPALDKAELTITASLINKASKNEAGVVVGTITQVNNINEGGTSAGGNEKISFSQKINLKKGGEIRFSKRLEVRDPKLWWPVHVGEQNLYELVFEVKSKSGLVSERDTVRFGIREVSTTLDPYPEDVPMIGQSAGADKNEEGPRTQKKVLVHLINGKRILIRGGDWTENMMMETTPAEEEAAILYAKNMNLNTLRLESFWGSDYFFDLADKHGIMIFNGLNCCSIWEEWDKWTRHTAEVAVSSLRDQVVRLRNHPSLVNWALGSDNYPPREIERQYIDVVETYHKGTPYITVMPNRISNIIGYTGYSERPDREDPPSAWYEKMEGMNWESGGVGGEQIAPIESMRAMMPKHDLWPISGSWDIRLWPGMFEKSRQALYDRYGKPHSLEEYSLSSQAWQYESNRAVYEAVARSKYLTSGTLKYRYNAGWPSLCFQFYDYYLRPNGSFFGAQVACEPLHVQYSYDDSSIYVVNSFYKPFNDLQVKATVYNMDLSVRFQKSGSLDILSDGSEMAFKIPPINGLTPIYYLYLELTDKAGDLISRNFYWLSVKADAERNFSALRALKTVDLKATSTIESKGKQIIASIVFENQSNELAFMVHPAILKGLHGEEVLPAYWSANYFSLLPNQSYTATVSFDSSLLAGEKPHFMVEGWNIKPREYALDNGASDVTPQLKYSEFVAPDSVGTGRNFIVSVKVTNEARSGKSILKDRVYLYINGQVEGYQHISLAPGESKTLIWPYVKIHEFGTYQVKAGDLPPRTVMGTEDRFFPIGE
ncbi:MAG TPA: glycoside hydrolase family 2 TIM barrel-domain containing protein [Flavitalea sp.]|nr:glycoside hydrolase family 2 TIM barrel-domain containing protein [Flavitalea sp.]